jgi:predicted enzyme related to lactoylglutathione lyase
MDKVTWFEIPADDTTRAGAFYSSVFGWNTSDMGGGSLMAVTSPTSSDDGTPDEPGAINGDISPRGEGFEHPLVVITVEDMDAKLKMVEEAGGTIVKPRTDIAEMNMAWAIVSDTEGNRVGIVQDL